MNQLRGILLVSLGAASYGILATIVKYASNNGAHISALTFYQALVGVVSLFILMKLDNRKLPSSTKTPIKSRRNLLLYGSSMGFTSCFYYLSVQELSVSIGIVLLMQSIWMSIVWEMIQQRKWAHWTKLIGTLLVLLGTLLTTKLFHQQLSLSIIGVVFGLLAALSYTVSLFASNQLETTISPTTRSFYLVLGGFIVVIAFWNVQLFEHLDTLVLVKYGLILGLFGTVIPPLMFTKGVPLIGIGLAGILAVLELPVSVLSARFVLGETLDLIQWTGILIIVITVVYINWKKR
jgi:drug/metabolite transporter (DMT)-like permease